MSMLENIKDQFKTLAAKLGAQIQESPAYAQAQDRYDSLSPAAQKIAKALGVAFLLLLVLFYPLSNLSSSSTALQTFEEKRNLIRELFRTYRESSSASGVVVPPRFEELRMKVDSAIARAELLPEQNLGVIESSVEGKLIPSALASHVLEVKLAKLNLKQIVDIGTSLVGISESVKMKDLLIRANLQDTRYFDATYKLYSLNVPEPPPEAPPEPESAKGKKPKLEKGSDE